jgi:hypothetical protein
MYHWKLYVCNGVGLGINDPIDCCVRSLFENITPSNRNFGILIAKCDSQHMVLRLSEVAGGRLVYDSLKSRKN